MARPGLSLRCSCCYLSVEHARVGVRFASHRARTRVGRSFLLLVMDEGTHSSLRWASTAVQSTCSSAPQSWCRIRCSAFTSVRLSICPPDYSRWCTTSGRTPRAVGGRWSLVCGGGSCFRCYHQARSPPPKVLVIPRASLGSIAPGLAAWGVRWRGRSRGKSTASRGRESGRCCPRWSVGREVLLVALRSANALAFSRAAVDDSCIRR